MAHEAGVSFQSSPLTLAPFAMSRSTSLVLPDSIATKKRLALTLLFVAISLKRLSFGWNVADVDLWGIWSDVFPACHGRVYQLNAGEAQWLLYQVWVVYGLSVVL